VISKLACLSQTSLPSPERSLELLNRLRESSTGLDLDRFGLAVAADDLVFSLVAWNSDAHPGGNPLLFVDESYDEPTQTTLYAGLLITPGAAFTLFGWYLGNLVTIRKQVPAFWPIDQPPPRLHFRELFNDAARQKTNWRHLPDQAIRDLISVVADAIGGNERVYPFVVRILNVELDKALKSAFPGGVNEEAADDLVGMIVAHALTATVVDNTRRGIEIDVVIDYDATRIYLAKMREEENVLDVGGRRQATQRFMEAMRAAAEAKNDPRLVIPSVDLSLRSVSTRWGAKCTDVRAST
jgi:hypothetical protein